ncbi:MAG: protein translocase subunit SecDF [Thermonemataceae bacterium]|nr:protein translocase subunit SecDF [Thermonemataceae bacterium]
MKNRPVVIFLTVLVAILSVYSLSFTWIGQNVRKEAEQKATTAKGVDFAKKQDILRNKSYETVYDIGIAQYDYNSVKKRELGLGLDLRGGMQFTLQVSHAELLKILAGRRAKEAVFQKALAQAKEKQKASSKKFTSLFAESVETLAPGTRLSRFFVSSTNSEITLQSTNQEVVSYLDKKIEESVDLAFRIIQDRIDKTGLANPSISKVPASGRIQIELPGVEDPERTEKLLKSQAKLEFWAVYDFQGLSEGFGKFVEYVNSTESSSLSETKKEDKANPFDKKEQNPFDKKTDSTDKTKDTTDIGKKDTTATKVDTNGKKEEKKKDSVKETKQDTAKKKTEVTPTNTAFAKLFKAFGENLYAKLEDTARINTMLNKEEVKAMFPSDMVYMWGAKINDEEQLSNGQKNPVKGYLPLYFLKAGLDGEPLLGGDVVENAFRDYDPQKGYGVTMIMNIKGAQDWAKITKENIGKQVAIVLDRGVYSAPVVQGEITGGNSSISGNFTLEEAQDLATILKSGKLPIPTEVVERGIVGPSLGQESINQGLISTLAALAVVFLFIFVYYNVAGLIVWIALIANIFFTLGVMASFGTILTLSGIAGFVLSVAMSIDANVLINERIREELQQGKTFAEAVKIGYTKAYSSILDSNITTFIIGVILYLLSEASLVRGFAITLMIGIVTSLFSSIFITRLITDIFVIGKGKSLSMKSAFFNSIFPKTNFDFVAIRKKAYIFSGAIILVGTILLVVQGGFTFGVDFTGGRSYVVAFNKTIPAGEVRENLAKVFKTATEVKTFNSSSQLKITTSYLSDDATADAKVEAKLKEGLAQYANAKPEIVSFTKVDSTVADSILATAQYAVIVSLIAMFIYILARFRYWQYGVGALISLAHNVLITLAFVPIAKILGLNLEIDQVFVASVLTVIGYSINDTVVVFDRIREFAKQSIGSSNFAGQLNEAINDTLSRTVVTGITTITTTLILLFFAGDVLRGFSFSMFIGIVFGTYSSIFIAAPAVLDFARRKGEEQAKKDAELVKATEEEKK